MKKKKKRGVAGGREAMNMVEETWSLYQSMAITHWLHQSTTTLGVYPGLLEELVLGRPSAHTSLLTTRNASYYVALFSRSQTAILETGRANHPSTGTGIECRTGLGPIHHLVLNLGLAEFPHWGGARGGPRPMDMPSQTVNH